MDYLEQYGIVKFQEQALSDMKEGRGFDHPVFREARAIYDEECAYIEKPYIISNKGFSKCVFCGSQRTFTVGRQDRAGDEPTSVFVTCTECSRTARTNN